MNHNKVSLFAWALCGIIAVVTVYGVGRDLVQRKYNAEQVLARFAQTARDETDLDSLTAELARVVQETMQSSGMMVWLSAPTQPLSPTNIPPNPSYQFQNPTE